VIGYDCFVHCKANVRDSIILSGCDIGREARLTRVILDKNCKIEPGCVIGEDPVEDAKRFPFVTESGIVVVPKGTLVPAKGPCVLANDVAELIGNDPELADKLEPGTFVVSMQSRHSYDSAGPRFKKYGEADPGEEYRRSVPALPVETDERPQDRR
jgi:glucose-1-phosphate adenylyltransferase